MLTHCPLSKAQWFSKPLAARGTLQVSIVILQAFTNDSCGFISDLVDLMVLLMERQQGSTAPPNPTGITP